MLDRLGVDDFAPHCGAAFSVGTEGRCVALKLLSATPLGRGAPAPGLRSGFSLLFGGPADAALPQGIHSVVHPVHGLLDIFLVPVGRDATGLQYEAVFN
jgi:hypothetical protein